MAKRNPSTTTWLWIAGGVGVVAYLYWNVNKQVDTIQKSGGMVQLPVFTDDCDANKLALAHFVADMDASGYKTTCDVNQVADPPSVCLAIAANLMMLPSKWPQACGPMPKF